MKQHGVNLGIPFVALCLTAGYGLPLAGVTVIGGILGFFAVLALAAVFTLFFLGARHLETFAVCRFAKTKEDVPVVAKIVLLLTAVATGGLLWLAGYLLPTVVIFPNVGNAFLGGAVLFFVGLALSSSPALSKLVAAAPINPPESTGSNSPNASDQATPPAAQKAQSGAGGNTTTGGDTLPAAAPSTAQLPSGLSSAFVSAGDEPAPSATTDQAGEQTPAPTTPYGGSSESLDKRL